MFSHEWRVGCQGQDLSSVVTEIEFMEVQQAERNNEHNGTGGCFNVFNIYA